MGEEVGMIGDSKGRKCLCFHYLIVVVNTWMALS